MVWRLGVNVYNSRAIPQQSYLLVLPCIAPGNILARDLTVTPVQPGVAAYGNTPRSRLLRTWLHADRLFRHARRFGRTEVSITVRISAHRQKSRVILRLVNDKSGVTRSCAFGNSGTSKVKVRVSRTAGRAVSAEAALCAAVYSAIVERGYTGNRYLIR